MESMGVSTMPEVDARPRRLDACGRMLVKHAAVNYSHVQQHEYNNTHRGAIRAVWPLAPLSA